MKCLIYIVEKLNFSFPIIPNFHKSLLMHLISSVFWQFLYKLLIHHDLEAMQSDLDNLRIAKPL